MLALTKGSEKMSQETIPPKRGVPYFPSLVKKAIIVAIVVAWILSLITAYALIHVAPSIFPPINTANISDGAVITTKLADGSVTSAKILDGTITAIDMADGSILTVKVADGAITTAKIANGAITTSKIADGAIVSVKLASNSVTSEKIADGSVTTAKIADDAIVEIKLADGAVTTAKILDGTITALDLANGAVTSIKIADGAITTTKIADYAVTNLKLAPYAIPFNSTYSQTEQSTSSTTLEDMPEMAVNITLDRTSHLIILFSTEAKPAYNQMILVQAMVNETTAYPGTIQLTPVGSISPSYASYSYNFYLLSLSSGTYTVKMQWRVDGGTGYIRFRTLTVIALPA